MSDGRKEKADRNFEMSQSKISIFCILCIDQNIIAMIQGLLMINNHQIWVNVFVLF